MPTQTAVFSFSLPSVGGDDDDWGGFLNGNWNALDTILNGTFDGEGVRTSTHFNIDALSGARNTFTDVTSIGMAGNITENVNTLETSGTVDIDPANGTVQTIAMTGDASITSSLTTGEFVTLLITSVDANTVTWPSMRWMYGNEPNLSTTADNYIQLWNIGGQLYGSYIGFAS